MLRFFRIKISRALNSLSACIDPTSYREAYPTIESARHTDLFGRISLKVWIGSILLIWLLYAIFGTNIAKVLSYDKINDVTHAGTWGDTFGAFNGLVSLAGAALVVSTIRLQQKALEDQKIALSAQAADSHKQRFEATFFELLKIRKELRDELDFFHSKEYINASLTSTERKFREKNQNGLDALSAFIAEFRHFNKIELGVDSIVESDKDISYIAGNVIPQTYDKVMSTINDRTFAPYYRLNYTILNRLRMDNVLSENDKEEYSKIFRSQLTNTELVSLAYNGLSPRSKDLNSLLTLYRMLKYMPESPARELLKKIYPIETFSARPEPTIDSDAKLTC